MSNLSPGAADAPRHAAVPSVPRALLGAAAVTALDAALLAFALGGLPALLSHPRALSLLAVWFIGAITLAVAWPVRPRLLERLDREPRWVLPALLLAPLLTPPLAALGERLDVLPWFAAGAVEWAGVVLAAAGLGIRVAAMTQLGARFSPLVIVQREHVLETGGLYARLRHPGYLGSWLASAGAMLAFGSALALPLVIAFLAILRARIRREEALLEGHFGEEYRRYRGRTGGMWPRLGPGEVKP